VLLAGGGDGEGGVELRESRDKVPRGFQGNRVDVLSRGTLIVGLKIRNGRLMNQWTCNLRRKSWLLLECAV
jgi:hypothetical protein